MKFAEWVDDMISDLADSLPAAKAELLECLDPEAELLGKVRDVRLRDQRIASREFYLLTSAAVIWGSVTVQRNGGPTAVLVEVCTKSYPLNAIVQVTRTAVLTRDPNGEEFDDKMVKFDFRFSAASGLGEFSLPTPEVEGLPIQPATKDEYYKFAQALSRLITGGKP